ncbi:MAG: CopG family transcriptional regulator [Archaeoglobales archaeon]|nr:CopG family transcriptional regulator [Archaeoglobales archaeon]
MKISIPKTLYEKIKARIEGTDFDSVSEYVTYVVREVLANLEEEKDITLTKEEEDKVKERLKALGYID